MISETTKTQEPVVVVQRLVAAINAVDADEIQELYAPTATIANPDGLVLSGEEGIRQFIQNVANFHIRVAFSPTEVQGEKVRGVLEIANDYHRQVGIAPLHIDFLVTVQDGKVTSTGGPFTEASNDKLGPLRASDRFYTALNATSCHGDLSLMNEVWSHAEDVTALHPVGGREIGWEQVWQGFNHAVQRASATALTVERIRVSDLRLVRLSDDLAYTLCTEHVDLSSGGQPATLQARATNIFRREGDTWKIIHHHADLFPGFSDQPAIADEG